MASITAAEKQAVNHAQDWLRRFGGDSVERASCSPAGDGRWVPLDEIIPERNAQGNAMRQAIRRLHAKGALAGYEIALYGGCLKAVPMENVAEAEQAVAQSEAARIAATA